VYEDDDLIQLSALQHFLFCPRQCALIYIEQLWEENLYTMEGELLHKRAHSGRAEGRPGKKTEFGMSIRSLSLGLSGKTDAVEYRDDGGIVIVEYKRGRPKKGSADEVQLCAQALCLEEMKGIRLAEGALYYGKTRRRRAVAFTTELRNLTRATAERLHAFIGEGKTPPPVWDEARCPRCSFLSVCLPRKLSRSASVARYIERMTANGSEEEE
jgi:CRISPR-associated exonuclease Cas4